MSLLSLQIFAQERIPPLHLKAINACFGALGNGLGVRPESIWQRPVEDLRYAQNIDSGAVPRDMRESELLPEETYD